MRHLVLDAEAVQALSGPKTKRRTQVLYYLEAASRIDLTVNIPAIVLSELYRGPARTAAIDSLLSRLPIAEIHVTDRPMARRVGAILSGAKLGSAFVVDAHVVAVAAGFSSSLILTGDVKDMVRLAAPFASVAIRGL